MELFPGKQVVFARKCYYWTVLRELFLIIEEHSV